METNSGYVYILEVKDIDLPVCKIGMTTRDPYDRCREINNSSTGDFLWAVANWILVDNCEKLERLLHSKLAPLRQKRREFFNIKPEDAYTALTSIFDNQEEIKQVEKADVVDISEPPTKKKTRGKRNYREIDSEYAELLHSFAHLLDVKGRPFGQLNKPFFGISDGHEGVQWNLAVHPDTDSIQLGVNLEGKKYDDWPISTFILSEIESAKIWDVRSNLANPEEVYIRFCRDAWQVTARPTIVESRLGGSEFSFAELTPDIWSRILDEALSCLDEEREYRGRNKQWVTLENIPKNGEQKRLMDVSPHLTVWVPVSRGVDVTGNIEERIEELTPVYQWVEYVCQ